MSDETIDQAVAALYEAPITLQELQHKVLHAPFETPGPTPPRDEHVYKLVYAYLQSKRDQLTPEQLDQFSAGGGGWICCGREITKLLAVVPTSSLDEVIKFAHESGFQAEVVG